MATIILNPNGANNAPATVANTGSTRAYHVVRDPGDYITPILSGIALIVGILLAIAFFGYLTTCDKDCNLRKNTAVLAETEDGLCGPRCQRRHDVRSLVDAESRLARLEGGGNLDRAFDNVFDRTRNPAPSTRTRTQQRVADAGGAGIRYTGQACKRRDGSTGREGYDNGVKGCWRQ